jgi:hypothetical protein
MVTPQRMLDSEYRILEFFMQITKCMDCGYANETYIDLTENRRKKNGEDENHIHLN